MENFIYLYGWSIVLAVATCVVLSAGVLGWLAAEEIFHRYIKRWIR